MMPDSRIRVFNVDDHALLREGVAAVITNQPDMMLVAQAATGRDAIRLFAQHRPDVTLMDLRLPDMSGIDAMMAIRSDAPEARVIVLTTFEGDVEMRRALEAGARGYSSRACRRRIWLPRSGRSISSRSRRRRSRSI